MQNLSSLSDEMIKELVPCIGTRIQFNKKLDDYKKQTTLSEEIIDENTPVVNSNLLFHQFILFLFILKF